MTKMLVEKGDTGGCSCIVMSGICGSVGIERGKKLSGLRSGCGYGGNI